MSLLKIEHLKKEYPDVTPLTDICAEIEKGDVVSIIGPSGTGKTTLLRCLNQLEEPTAGTVLLNGEMITDPGCDICGVRRKMGMVFQSFNLFADRTVIENIISAPVDLMGIPHKDVYREGMELLKRVGLEDKADCFPDELSGGQQQRAAIVRAVMMKPELLLLDEPTSALDPTMTDEVISVIKNLAEEGMTMMIVTHEMKLAREISNRIFYMDEGVIYEEGSPEQIFDDPRREKTRQFIKQLKTLSLEIDSDDVDLTDMFRRIDRYGRESMIPSEELRKIILVFEELVFQNILVHIRKSGNGYPVGILVEHSGTDGTAEMYITYAGDPFDPLSEGDDLSVAIVKRMASDISYSYEGGNRIKAGFRCKKNR